VHEGKNARPGSRTSGKLGSTNPEPAKRYERRRLVQGHFNGKQGLIRLSKKRKVEETGSCLRVKRKKDKVFVEKGLDGVEMQAYQDTQRNKGGKKVIIKHSFEKGIGGAEQLCDLGESKKKKRLESAKKVTDAEPGQVLERKNRIPLLLDQGKGRKQHSTVFSGRREFIFPGTTARRGRNLGPRP